MCADKTGVVKEEAFFTLLKLHGIELSNEEVARLKKAHVRGGKLNYSEALHSINVDLDVAVLNEQKWTVPLDKISKTIETAQPSKAHSHLSRLSLREFNNERAAELAIKVDLGDYGQIPAPTVVNNDTVTSVTKVTKPV